MGDNNQVGCQGILSLSLATSIGVIGRGEVPERRDSSLGLDAKPFGPRPFPTNPKSSWPKKLIGELP